MTLTQDQAPLAWPPPPACGGRSLAGEEHKSEQETDPLVAVNKGVITQNSRGIRVRQPSDAGIGGRVQLLGSGECRIQQTAVAKSRRVTKLLQ